MTVFFVVVFLATLAYRAASAVGLERAHNASSRNANRAVRERRTAELERDLGMSLDPPEGM